MIETEFIKSMQSNYARIQLSELPEEQRYQYCIVSRGGIKGLLPCSLRYVNGTAYLYYDITSRQSLVNLYRKKTLGREWVKSFAWSLKHVQQELHRFLLDERNVIWFPESVYQELDRNDFQVMYIPYFSGENGFLQLLEFMVERMDYSDDALVECVYKIYEQYEKNGDVYLQEKIFSDIERLDHVDDAEENGSTNDIDEEITQMQSRHTNETFDIAQQCVRIEDATVDKNENIGENQTKRKNGVKNLFSFLENNRKKDKATRNQYMEQNYLDMNGLLVAEDTSYQAEIAADDTFDDEEDSHTVYIEHIEEDATRRIFDEDGKVLVRLADESIVLGKKNGEADVVINRDSVSRIHARISKEKDAFYIEDLNSTNGTFKNGMRMNPYEKRQLFVGDEIRLGNVNLSFQ